MSKRHTTLLALAALFILLSTTTTTADEQKKNAAITAAEEFLQTIDSGQYDNSWDMTANLFKSQISKDMWARQLGGVLPQFGILLKRELTSTQYVTQLPGAPDGEYVVIQYAASYEKKLTAVETVTPMLEHDGQWRVTGYYIK